ncbi:hypothetical protein [Sphingobium yanoikuyae]|uniref:hypothetical protein n=1 Tax=Sphingobium yanoikuyae TaxID=13690 RepID=UPI0028982D20|nr:hypothetical protein [Sphingobium yanoikuyae]
MLTEISAGLNSLKAAKDILQALNGIQSAVAVNEVKFNLQSLLLNAQQSLFAAQEAQAAAAKRIADLEQQIVRLKDWSAEKGRYQLRDVGRGSFAYVVKPGMEQGEPPHWLCTNCFDHGRKSFMQSKGNGVGNRTVAERGLDKTYACDSCKGSFQVGWSNNPERDRERMIAAAKEAALNEERMRDSMADDSTAGNRST